MKYIIELPEEVKEKFDNANKEDIYGNYYDYNSVIGNAIKDGIPLPKGHGDLKDTQDIINRLNLNYNNHQTINVQSIKDIIQTTPTIIEADKGE